jgi:hypothetical protein
MVNISRPLTKFQMAKIVISTLYNLDSVCTSHRNVCWQRAKALSRNHYLTINSQYMKALEILKQKGDTSGTDIIGEWVKLSVEGEQA